MRGKLRAFQIKCGWVVDVKRREAWLGDSTSPCDVQGLEEKKKRCISVGLTGSHNTTCPHIQAWISIKRALHTQIEQKRRKRFVFVLAKSSSMSVLPFLLEAVLRGCGWKTGANISVPCFGLHPSWDLSLVSSVLDAANSLCRDGNANL